MKQVVAAIFIRNGKILMGRRAAHKSYPNCWDLIGGHVESRETVEQALVREAREEVGLSPLDFAAISAVREPAGRAVCHLFAVRAWEGGEPVMLGDEHTELAWFALSEAAAIDDLALEDYRAVFQAMTSR